MKTLGLLIFAAFSLNSFAAPAPQDLCDRFCTESMKKILVDFESASHEPSQDLAAFSGSCFHIHPNLKPDHEHHGVMLLRGAHPDKRFSGLFSFYAKENPYQNLSLTGVRDLFDGRGSRKHLIKDEGELESVLIESESAQLFYWLKTTATEAWLLSLWHFKDSAADVRIFCHFPKAHRG